MARLLVTGSSRIGTAEAIAEALQAYRNPRPFSEPSVQKVIVLDDGDVSDRATAWAKEHGVPVRTFMSNGDAHGMAAHAIRNRRAVREGRPDLVLIFGPASLWDITVTAHEAGVEVREIVPVVRRPRQGRPPRKVA